MLECFHISIPIHPFSPDTGAPQKHSDRIPTGKKDPFQWLCQGICPSSQSPGSTPGKYEDICKLI